MIVFPCIVDFTVFSKPCEFRIIVEVCVGHRLLLNDIMTRQLMSSGIVLFFTWSSAINVPLLASLGIATLAVKIADMVKTTAVHLVMVTIRTVHVKFFHRGDNADLARSLLQIMNH